MTANELYEILVKIGHALQEIIVGGVGGMVAYMVEFKRARTANENHKWNSASMVMHIFMGSFMAYVAGSFMPHDMVYRDGLIGLIGLTSYTIIGLIESRFATWLIDIIMAVLGGKNGK